MTASGDVWTPRGTPPAPQVRVWVRAVLTADVLTETERSDAPSPNDDVLQRLTPPQRHILAAAHRGVSAVVVGARGDDGGAALAIGAAIAGGLERQAVLVTDAEDVAARAATLGVAVQSHAALSAKRPSSAERGTSDPAWFIDAAEGLAPAVLAALLHDAGSKGSVVLLCEPTATGRSMAETIAAAHGSCGHIEALEWDQMRTRVFAPFRNEPFPDPAGVATAFEQERARAECAGEITRLAVDTTPTAWARALGRTTASDRVGVLLCRDARECLRGLIIADSARRGRFFIDEEAEIERSAEQIISTVREMLKRSRERAVYAVLAALPSNRGNASAIVAMVERQR